MESVEIKLRRSGNVSKQKAEIGDYRKVTLVNEWMEFYYSVNKSNIQKKRQKKKKPEKNDNNNNKKKKPQKNNNETLVAEF